MNEFASGCIPRSRMSSSRSDRQIRQADLSVAYFPVVRNLRTERVEARDLRGVVRDRRGVRDDRIRMADALEAIPDVGRDRHQRVVALADEHLLQLALGRGAVAVVEEDKLDRAVRDGVVDGHPLVEMPTLDDARVDGREVDLAESLEVRIVRSE